MSGYERFMDAFDEIATDDFAELDKILEQLNPILNYLKDHGSYPKLETMQQRLQDAAARVRKLPANKERSDQIVKLTIFAVRTLAAARAAVFELSKDEDDEREKDEAEDDETEDDGNAPATAPQHGKAKPLTAKDDEDEEDEAEDDEAEDDGTAAPQQYDELNAKLDTMIRACNHYVIVGGGSSQAWLADPSKKLLQELSTARALPSGDKKQEQYKEAAADFTSLKKQVIEKVVQPPPVAWETPDTPEAQISDAIKPALCKQCFQDLAHNHFAFGTNSSGLEPGEQVAIYFWTTEHGCEEINHHLRNKPEDDLVGGAARIGRAKKVTPLIEAALKKLPDYTSTTTTRGEKEWDGAEKRYQVNSEFTITEFWATGVGCTFPGKYQITIVGKTGKNISAMSEHPHENEILFPPFTRFRVVRRKDDPANNKVFVKIEELS